MIRSNLVRLFALSAGLLLMSIPIADVQAQSDLSEKLSAETFRPEGGGELKYRLLKPANLEQGKKYPVVLFLHGAGERGDDNVAQMKHGVKEFVKRQEHYPCFVIAPQVPTGKRWVEVDWSAESHDMPDQPSDQLGMARKLIDKMIAEKSVDPDRIYVTGLSMGGYGTWDAVQRWPDFFAAAAPICGGGDPAYAGKLKSIPIWCFHGDKDEAVNVERSRAMIAAIREAGGEPKYTEYPGVGHDSWSRSYADDAFFEWLFAQQREEK